MPGQNVLRLGLIAVASAAALSQSPQVRAWLAKNTGPIPKIKTAWWARQGLGIDKSSLESAIHSLQTALNSWRELGETAQSAVGNDTPTVLEDAAKELYFEFGEADIERALSDLGTTRSEYQILQVLYEGVARIGRVGRHVPGRRRDDILRRLHDLHQAIQEERRDQTQLRFAEFYTGEAVPEARITELISRFGRHPLFKHMKSVDMDHVTRALFARTSVGDVHPVLT